MGTGAKAGLGIGIAVAAVIVVGLSIFFVIHFRRSRHLAAINQERAILAGEKNKDGSDKPDVFAPPPRNLHLPPPACLDEPNPSRTDSWVLFTVAAPSTSCPCPRFAPTILTEAAPQQWREHTGTTLMVSPSCTSPGPTARAPRPSFSSKRATRMMMMM